MAIEINTAIRLRLDGLLANNVACKAIGPEVAAPIVDEIRHLAHPAVPQRKIDASDASRGAVVQWLSELPIDRREQVSIFWPSYRAGATLRYEDFIHHYDDLWYPGADDVWVVDDTRQWLLELDHEEQFSLKCPAP